MKVGVLDIGTLKVKFLVANLTSSNNIKPIYESNSLTCLGVRIKENNNRPLPEYLQQTIDELKRCKRILEKEKVKKIRVVSTHALREMGKVGKEIARTIKDQVGLKVEIISQTEEANLFFQAVIKDFDTSDDFTLVDVGGGSVQILIGNKNKLKHTFLLKTGAQFLFDNFSPRHRGIDFPTREEIRQMQEYIMQELTPLPKNSKTPVIYGSSCIIDLFKALKVKLDRYPNSKSHPYKVSISELEKFLENIIPIPYDQREKQYPFEQKYYMWGVDKALINILSICKRQKSPYVIPTNNNINDGLVLSLI